jgi:hypothetical protein
MRTAVLKTLIISSLLILSAGSGWARDYSFTYTCDNQGQVLHPDSIGYFTTILINTGTVADTYRVVMDHSTLDTLWHCLACFSTFCFFDSATVEMAPAQVETITVDIMPFGTPGASALTMRVRSFGDPGQTEAIPLTVVTDTGVDVLVVDDDGSEDYEKYYQAALDSAGLTHGTLNHGTTIVDTSELLPFSAVVWFTGEATPVLTERDRQIISAYLESGGRLFISGQDVAYALCDSASGESDSASVVWFERTFLALYEENDSGILSLDGIEGYPISDGLTINISGGDGADNQTSPDVIMLFGGIEWIPLPEPVFFYAGGWSCGASVLDEFNVGYKVVYFAFGFEAIDNGADRALVMNRVMDWLMTPTAVEDQVDVVSRPVDFFLSQNYPNPFNATTAFRLTIPGQNPASVSLKIYNVLGQEVRTLVDDIMSPGHHHIIWDGRDRLGKDLASGVYFSRMEVGDFDQTRKLVLTR